MKNIPFSVETESEIGKTTSGTAVEKQTRIGDGK